MEEYAQRTEDKTVIEVRKKAETREEYAKRTEKTIIPGIDETLDEYAQRMKEQGGKAKVGCLEECKVKTLKSGKEVECGRMCSIEEEHEISECKCKMCMWTQ